MIAPTLSVVPIRTAASAEASRSASSTSATSPPVSSPQRLDRRLAGLAHLGRQSSEIGAAHDADPQPGGVTGRELLAEQDRAEQAAAGGVGASGPETIVVVTAAMWWPSIAERPKVGFSPVTPQ